jgi:multidrug efflux pump subunit AcrA (membrane-fusion protein)
MNHIPGDFAALQEAEGRVKALRAEVKAFEEAKADADRLAAVELLGMKSKLQDAEQALLTLLDAEERALNARRNRLFGTADTDCVDVAQTTPPLSVTGRVYTGPGWRDGYAVGCDLGGAGRDLATHVASVDGAERIVDEPMADFIGSSGAIDGECTIMPDRLKGDAA